MRLLPELDPDQRDEGFPRPAATLPLPPNFFVDRRVWRFDTSSDWWDRLVMEIWDDQDWLRNFRMRKTTFQELCTWLAPALQRQDTHLRPAIPLEKRVAIALWKLATPDSYRSVGHQFGVGRSTVGAVLMEVVRAINSELLNRLICLPDLDSVEGEISLPWGTEPPEGSEAGGQISEAGEKPRRENFMMHACRLSLPRVKQQP
ncbi:uncharacterized protein LOC142819396 [Pelodiscus sinensis]|uniref:uncharacterized protein LOC142819396 n=1 Tax=Pelodiscus sinensis TaxID=13735 RepID=UPI003F6C2064